MKGLRHFIIEVKEPFKDKVQVGNLQLFVDKKISRDRSANRFGKVISCPILEENFGLEEGFEIVFDATILYQQIYKEGVQESIHLMNKEKSLYKVEPDMIILFRENQDSDWKGFKDNLMVEFITEVPKLSSNLIALPKAEVIKGKAKLKYINENLENEGLENGQVIYMNPSVGIPFFFKDQTLYWIRTKDVLAV